MQTSFVSSKSNFYVQFHEVSFHLGMTIAQTWCYISRIKDNHDNILFKFYFFLLAHWKGFINFCDLSFCLSVLFFFLKVYYYNSCLVLGFSSGRITRFTFFSFFLCAGAVPVEPFGDCAVLRHESPLSVLLLCSPRVLLVPHCLPRHGHLASHHPGVGWRWGLREMCWNHCRRILTSLNVLIFFHQQNW